MVPWGNPAEIAVSFPPEENIKIPKFRSNPPGNPMQKHIYPEETQGLGVAAPEEIQGHQPEGYSHFDSVIKTVNTTCENLFLLAFVVRLTPPQNPPSLPVQKPP